jgi:hypothetical protein
MLIFAAVVMLEVMESSSTVKLELLTLFGLRRQ